MEKREPITIDVTPEQLHVEREPVRLRQPREKSAPFVKPYRPRSPLAQARDLARMGKIVQREDFWIGLLVQTFGKWH